MRKTSIIIVTFSALFLAKLYGQRFVCIADSTPIYASTVGNIEDPSLEKIIGHLGYGDSIEVEKQTKDQAVLTYLSSKVYHRKFIFSKWYKVKTSGNQIGWVPALFLRKSLRALPQKVPGIIEGDTEQDEIYLVGWNKNYAAYIVEGYLIGKLDGITVRFVIHNFNTGKQEVYLVDYTSRKSPISTFWKQQSINIHLLLEQYKIQTADNEPIPLHMPIVPNKKDTMWHDIPLNTDTMVVRLSYQSKAYYSDSLLFSAVSERPLRWIVNPTNKNTILMVVAFIPEDRSTGFYIRPISINLKRFKKIKN